MSRPLYGSPLYEGPLYEGPLYEGPLYEGQAPPQTLEQKKTAGKADARIKQPAVADSVRLHSFATRAYLEQIVRPLLATELAAAGKSF
jgi:hypothetical protein